jgi:hypothetical protein
VKRLVTCAALFVLVLTVRGAGAFAQTTVTSGTVTPKTEIDTKEFPLWARDLRRGEIIAFGSFPFTMFAATFAMDAWRWTNHDMDQKYAPWPFKAAGAVNMTNEEHERTMIIAAAASVTIALADFVIVKVKNYQKAQRALKMPEGSPITIKRTNTEETTEMQSLPPAPPPSNEEPEQSAAESAGIGSLH